MENRTLKGYFNSINLIPLLLIFFTACQDNENSVQEIQTEGKISSIIRNPVTMEGPVDTVNVAKMKFETTVYDFGEVKEGELVKYVFKFTNEGKIPLVINNAQSSCGCTVPSWPKSPIGPGESGEIAVEFNTSGKPEFQEKQVTITANTYPATTKVYLRGLVNAKAQ